MTQPSIILVVDDIAANRQTLRELLDAPDYLVLEAADGPAGLRLAAETPPDLVLLDVMMPGMDGFEVCRRLRADAHLAAVPVVMVTALDDQASRTTGIQAGADDFITKPFNRAELRARVHTITRLNRYRRLMEAQAALRESEQNFRCLFESSRDALVTLEPPDWTLARANSAALKMFRVRDEPEFIAHRPEEFSAARQPDGSESGTKVREMIAATLREGAAAFEWTHRRIGGEEFPADVLMTGVQLPDRIIVQGTIRDITEPKRIEDELRSSERKFLSVFQNAAVGIMITAGPGFRIVEANRRLCGMLGYTAGELRQLASRDLIQPDEAAPDPAPPPGAARSPDHPQERRFRHKDGSGVWAKVFVAPLDPLDADGARKIEVIEDITAQKQAETDLRESAERYRLLFESNPVPMWLNDPVTQRFLAVNRSAVEHYGHTREEFLRMTIRDLHLPEDLAALRLYLGKEAGAATRTCEWRHRRKDGTVMQVEVISTSLRFDGRESRLVLASDVTEKKLLEEKFLHAQRLESIGMLAAGIAHDLNNVLAPIMFAAPLLRNSLSTPRDLKILDTLEHSAGRGAGLVKQILGFAHTATGERHPLQVKHLVRDIIDVIEATFPKSIQLKHQIDSDLWPVQGNATQVHQVLLNLCVNARDAMPEGGTLHLAATNRRIDAVAAGAIPGGQPGAWLVLEVKDTGTGIAPDVLERIWTPFFTTKGVGKGTGLGLSTVRSIVLSHHGFIATDTTLGGGSTFRVFLPAVEGETHGPGSAAPFVRLEGHGEFILVADDDQAIRDLVAEILGNHGYHVLICSDGLEALTLINNRPGDIPLLITDVDMPRLHGIALVHAVRQLRPDIRLLAMSGLDSPAATAPDLPVIKGLAHAFLAKPFSPDELLGAVHGLLQTSAPA